MHAFLTHSLIGLRLHFRNIMAVVYGYLFPTIFLVAFWTLYRYEQTPLIRHIGELLTITVLGGACFGLPTTLVSERERGVWRRYRLTPVSTATLVASTLTTRYVLLVIAALLQLGLAMALGMPAPRHPGQLFVAFSCTALALMGLGLTIAALADNVPAVQALGQCVFLPMLILGGVAVPLASLPPWAERLSAFFPGRYAVEVISATAAGDGLRGAGYAVFALLAIAVAATATGLRMFRWDRGQRFRSIRGKGWIAVTVGMWVVVGALAQPRADANARAARTEPATSVTPPPAESAAALAAAPAVSPPPAPQAAPAVKDTAHVTPPVRSAGRAEAEEPVAILTSWRQVTSADVLRDITFDRLPPDAGIVTPIADPADMPDADAAATLADVAGNLDTWPPALVDDPVQRVRNLLAVLATPDVLQQPFERFLPAVIFDHILKTTPQAELLQILYWIAMHPDGGTQPSPDDLVALGLPTAGADPLETRNRAAIYGVKLLGRVMGRL